MRQQAFFMQTLDLQHKAQEGEETTKVLCCKYTSSQAGSIAADARGQWATVWFCQRGWCLDMLPRNARQCMVKVHAIQSEQHVQGCRRYPTGSTFANYSSKSSERFSISVNIKLVESKHFFCHFAPYFKKLAQPFLLTNDSNHQTNAQTRLPGCEIGRLDTFPVEIRAFLKIIPFWDDLGQKSIYFWSWI